MVTPATGIWRDFCRTAAAAAVAAAVAACSGQIGGFAPPAEVARARPQPTPSPVPPAATPRPEVRPSPTAPLLRSPIPTPTTVPTPTPTAPLLAAVPPAPATPEPTPPVAAETPLPPVVSFTVPLSSLSDLDSLDGRPEIDAIIEAARRYPKSPIYLAAYATDEDGNEAGTSAQSVSEDMVVAMGAYLARRDVPPDRIAGKGLGTNPLVGRAVIVSIDVAGVTARTELSQRQIAEAEAARQAPARFPKGNISFKEIGDASAYRVGPGDQLAITNSQISGGQQLTVTVSPAGTISFDLANDVPVAGLTVEEIENLMENVLRRYYRNPRLTVAIATFASRQITIVGPSGMRLVALKGRTTLFDLLASEQVESSGGLPTQGNVGLPDLKDVRVVRGKQTFRMNLFRIMLERDWSENIVLDQGDVVYIPAFSETGNYAIVLGAVQTPGIYPIPRSTTAVQALYLAGGPVRGGYLPHARILRGDAQNPQIIPADIDLVIDKGQIAANKTLESGDILFVPTTRIANWNNFLSDIAPTVNLATSATIGAGLITNRAETRTIIISPTPVVPLPLP